MAYEHKEIEKKWRERWRDLGTYRVENDATKPKYYVLDMFPYPSGAGLHVGHPLGYIASDIVARFKRHSGFNVLHPMGYDSFGLPAEQYAIQTGQHPAKTTEVNIARYREQLDRIGFSFDWSREVRTSDPAYYRWTQWVFLQLFDSWYNIEVQRAEPISSLIRRFEHNGFTGIDRRRLTGDEDMEAPTFTAEEWKAFNPREQEAVLQYFRLAYRSEAWVNWCPALGTVLANDEVKDGVSERGGHPVERKRMPQWSMRITAYAQRLLDSLDELDWSESIKEAQRNWIGRSRGALVKFPVVGHEEVIEVFTTRPDTLFGVTFVTLAPEHQLVDRLVTPERRAEVMAYCEQAKNRSERDRMADVKSVSGAFTGAYVKHPFTGADVPVWVGDYVLVGYATGAVMAVPGGDQRDWNFAKHFNLPIIAVTEGADIAKEADERKDATLINSGFLNGLEVPNAITRAIQELETLGVGEGRINYRLRDAAFGRQRYWGEPIPIYYEDGLPKALPDSALPLRLPEVDKFLPTADGEPPLARADNWSWDSVNQQLARSGIGNPLETTTMPGWAGSSWYWLRYMDPANTERFAGKEAVDYWKQVDLYVGGSEHATGHLLYVRFWTKFLFDRGHIAVEEPAQKLVNQGMIQGVSKFYYEVRIAPELNQGYDSFARELHIFRGEQLLKSIHIPVPRGTDGKPDWRGHAVYHSYGCQLVFKYYDTAKQKYIPTVSDSGRANALFVTETLVDNQVKYAHGLLDSFLKVEPHYRPIVVTDFPFDAYWHYEAKLWRDFSNMEVNQSVPLWLVRAEVEKMSKSKNNVVSPDDQQLEPRSPIDLASAASGYYFPMEQCKYVVPGIIEKYGADTLRLYEMFLGPLEQSKPWDTNGIEGTSRFLKKFWNLFHAGSRDQESGISESFNVSEEEPTKPELKVLHSTLKKVTEDIEKLSFNTSVSQFMIAVNELGALKCHKRDVLEPLTIALAPFAPHIAEELWSLLGQTDSITTAPWPQWQAEHLVEDSFSYPISFNGKTRLQLEFPMELDAKSVEAAVLANPEVQARLEGKLPKKVIVVPKRIVNIVV